MVKAWEAPHLLSKFVKQMKDWSEDERYALGEKLENIKECAWWSCSSVGRCKSF